MPSILRRKGFHEEAFICRNTSSLVCPPRTCLVCVWAVLTARAVDPFTGITHVETDVESSPSIGVGPYLSRRTLSLVFNPRLESDLMSSWKAMAQLKLFLEVASRISRSMIRYSCSNVAVTAPSTSSHSFSVLALWTRAELRERDFSV